MTPAQQRAQRDDALAKANRVRLARAELKRQIAAGGISILGVLAGELDDEHVDGGHGPVPIGALIATVPIVEILTWAHRWGRSRARKAMWTLNVSEARFDSLLLSNLSEPRRRALISVLRIAGGLS